MLLRAEKAAEGMKGVYLPLSDGNVGSYEVRLDAQGSSFRNSSTIVPEWVLTSLPWT